MAAPERFHFNLDEEFPHLPSAPIVEAVIHWRARAEKQWDADSLRNNSSSGLLIILSAIRNVSCESTHKSTRKDRLRSVAKPFSVSD